MATMTMGRYEAILPPPDEPLRLICAIVWCVCALFLEVVLVVGFRSQFDPKLENEKQKSPLPRSIRRVVVVVVFVSKYTRDICFCKMLVEQGTRRSCLLIFPLTS